jgi:hypothetical protein
LRRSVGLGSTRWCVPIIFACYFLVERFPPRQDRGNAFPEPQFRPPFKLGQRHLVGGKVEAEKFRPAATVNQMVTVDCEPAQFAGARINL